MRRDPDQLPDGTALRHRDVPVDGIRLHVVEAGPADGPAVLLLHGFPEFWWEWRQLIGPLAAAGYRVVAPDGRGYAGSDKPRAVRDYALPRLGADVIGIADALGLERFGLVGHDWGGIVAWWVAARHPDRAVRLAIANAPHPDAAWAVIRADPAQLRRSWYIAAFQVPVLAERQLAQDDFAWLARGLRGSSRRGTFSMGDLEPYRAAWREPGALSGMLAWYRALVRHPAGRAGRVRVPTLILWGRNDIALGPACATESLPLCDDARIRWFDDATHWLPHEEPDAVAAALLDHMRPVRPA